MPATLARALRSFIVAGVPLARCRAPLYASTTPASLSRSFVTMRRAVLTQQHVPANLLAWTSGSRRTMFIQTEQTPNDDSLKFIPGVEVMGTGSAEFLDTRAALASPLAIRLMGIDGVRAVFYGPDFVTVSKDADTPWPVLKPEIYSMLMEHFSAQQPLFRSQEERDAAGPQDTRILDTDSDTVAMIKELLDTRVRPAIMEDGGDIEYRGFSPEGVVSLKLKGSCRGCDSSTVTLKSGIERMLMHYIPEVTAVEQVLDQEETIAMDEFAKFEQQLAQKQKTRDSPMAAYMSP